MNQPIRLLLLSTLVIPVVSQSSAGSYTAQPFHACQHNFYNKAAPLYQGSFQVLTKDSYALCFNGFAVNYSGISKTPLWSAEYLNIARLRQASKIDREDSFHAEERVVPKHRATLSDYKGSGFDRGHLSPNADMANKTEQHDSFSLANITPQHPDLNRNLWREVEHVTRGLVYEYNETWVVTGVAFNSKKVRSLNGNVLVPSDQYKAVYIPSQNMAGAYYAPNNDSQVIEIISLNELKVRTGLDAFPAVSNQTKEQVGQLPFPNYNDFKSSASKERVITSPKDTNNGSQAHDDSDRPANEQISLEEGQSILFKLIAILRSLFSILS